MRLADAQIIAQKALAILQPFCERIEIAGSIRRRKREVGDIDIVDIPKGGWYASAFGFDVEFSADKVWTAIFPAVLRKGGLKVEASGEELLRCVFVDGFQFDVYRARAETWGVILLVGTGSKEHNVKLCTLALSKGLKLSAAQGILKDGQNIASRSEGSIFAALGLAFVNPENREVW